MPFVQNLFLKFFSMVGCNCGVDAAIKLGAEVSGGSAAGNSALILAVKGNHARVIDTLIDYGVDIHHDYSYAAGLAAALGHLAALQRLVEEGTDIHSCNDWALRWAARHGHASIVEYLLIRGADPNALDSYAVMVAIENGATNVVRVLLERGSAVPALRYNIARSQEKGYIQLSRLLMNYSNVLARRRCVPAA